MRSNSLRHFFFLNKCRLLSISVDIVRSHVILPGDVMQPMEFNDALKVKNVIIDQEHEVLIDYINLLQMSMVNEASNTLLHKVLQGLVEYTKTHFFVEEEFMKAFHYPDASAHRAAHEAFRHKIADVLRDVERGEANLSADIMQFLQHWLTEHILKIDRKLSDFLADKSLAAP